MCGRWVVKVVVGFGWCTSLFLSHISVRPYSCHILVIFLSIILLVWHCCCLPPTLPGAPRCGLCTQPVAYNDDDKPDVKGFFRLNNECQECPENPGLILVLLAVAVVFMCVAGWWAQTKKINISILSIGVDYFQILSIFAGLRVKWPSWVKQMLQILSIFNLNIDIAGPECAFPDFDYKTKWMLTVITPLIFAAVLILVFLSVACLKCVLFYSGNAKKGVKYVGEKKKTCCVVVVCCVVIVWVSFQSQTHTPNLALTLFSPPPPLVLLPPGTRRTATN